MLEKHLVMALRQLVMASEVLKRLLGPISLPASSVARAPLTAHGQETAHLIPACPTPTKGVKLRESLRHPSHKAGAAAPPQHVP